MIKKEYLPFVGAFLERIQQLCRYLCGQLMNKVVAKFNSVRSHLSDLVPEADSLV